VAGFALPADSYVRRFGSRDLAGLACWSQMGTRECASRPGELRLSAPVVPCGAMPADVAGRSYVGILAASGVLIRMAASRRLGRAWRKASAGAGLYRRLWRWLSAQSSRDQQAVRRLLTGLWYLGVLNRVPVLRLHADFSTGQPHRRVAWLHRAALCCSPSPDDWRDCAAMAQGRASPALPRGRPAHCTAAQLRIQPDGS